MRIVDSSNFPAASTIAAALVNLEPGAMRELHWHEHDEWQYYIKGSGRMTVFASSGKARTFNYQAGDVGYIPKGMAHYVQNLGNEPLRYGEAQALGTAGDDCGLTGQQRHLITVLCLYPEPGPSSHIIFHI